MSKIHNVQKKKTLANTISQILFKVLVGIAVIIFIYILIEKTDFSGGSMTFTSVKKNNNNNTYTPTDLKWYDSFRGIENVPKKKSEKSKGSNGNTGFKYEGFKK